MTNSRKCYQQKSQRAANRPQLPTGTRPEVRAVEPHRSLDIADLATALCALRSGLGPREDIAPCTPYAGLDAGSAGRAPPTRPHPRDSGGRHGDNKLGTRGRPPGRIPPRWQSSPWSSSSSSLLSRTCWACSWARGICFGFSHRMALVVLPRFWGSGLGLSSRLPVVCDAVIHLGRASCISLDEASRAPGWSPCSPDVYKQW